MEKVCIKEDDMNYVIAVFSSRSETLSFANFLRRQSIPNAIVSTPKEAGRSCGLSVKFSYEYFAEVKMVLPKMRESSFKGFFIEQNVGGRPVVVRDKYI